jgi:hypothetical protein
VADSSHPGTTGKNHETMTLLRALKLFRFLITVINNNCN